MRIKHGLTKADLRKIAVLLIKRHGIGNLTRREVCRKANLPEGSFNKIIKNGFKKWVCELEKENIPQPKNITLAPHVVSNKYRKLQLLSLGVQIAKTKGYLAVSFNDIANVWGVTRASLYNYFPSEHALRKNLLTHAISVEYVPVIAQGLTNNELKAKHINPKLKKKVINYMKTL